MKPLRNIKIQFPAGSPGLKHSLRAFRSRNYRLYFSGQFLSLIGTWMQNIAQSWLVYQLSHSPVLLGLVGFAGQIPVLFLGPVAGIVVDHVPKRKLILYTQVAALLQAVVIAALTFAGVIQVWHVFVLALTLGVINAFDVPARQSFVVELVGRADLMNAIALNSSMVNGARIIGPAIAGILVASFGEGYCFLINAVSYTAVVGGLLLMDIPKVAPVRRAQSAMELLQEGFQYVVTTNTVKILLLLLGLISVMGMPYMVLMPIFADQILHGDARALGILMGSSGVGAMFGALVLAARTKLLGLEKIIVGSAFGFGAFLVLFSWSHIFWLSVALLFPTGFFFMLQMAATNTMIQSLVPDRLRGRVMSFYSMMFLGMAPIGSLAAGVIAKFIGAPWTVALGGFACCFGAWYLKSFLSNRSVEKDLSLAVRLEKTHG
jgi:MFS family permease